MLFNSNMRPAFATAGSNNMANADQKSTKDLFTRSDVDEDFNSFGKTAERPRPAAQRPARPSQTSRPAQSGRPPQHRRKPQSNIPWKPIIIAGIAVIALILIVVIAVAIFSAPQKNIKLEDNVYFTYVDAEGKYRIVFNDNVLKETFDGEISIIPSKDASFAYVLEDIGESKAKYKMYILEDKKLSVIEAVSDGKPLALAEYAPGIVYEQDSRIHYYSKEDQIAITSEPSADNFMISGDANTVVYTVESQNNEELTELKYFCNGGSATVGPYNFAPAVLSIDGKYIYGIYKNILCYVTVENGGESYDQKIISNNNFGEILGITGINVEGNEIIFCSQPAGKDTPVSYMYKLKDSEPTQIAEGIFTPIYADSDIVCPETFLNSYFLCRKEVTDEDGKTKTEISTYFLDKKQGARKMCDGMGQFSADKKYFYYVSDDNSTLLQLDLKSKDFSKGLKSVIPSDVTAFTVTETGDIYAVVDKGYIYYWDRSDNKRSLISSSADANSMTPCTNSIYFSETSEENVTTVYISTEGSAKQKAEFKSSVLIKTPEIKMGADKKGYAYFIDESGATRLFYTSNGKKFSLISGTYTIPNFTPETE